MEDNGVCSALGTFSDNLGEYYGTIARDKNRSPQQREAALYFAMAEGHLNNEQAEKALEAAEESLQRFRTLEDENGIADILRLIVHVYCLQDRRKDANKLARDELERVQKGKDRSSEGKLLLAIAEANLERRGHQNREQALGFAAEALSRFKAQQDKKFQAYAMLALLNIHLKRRGDKKQGAEKALGFAQEARLLFRSVGDRRGEAVALHSFAVAQIKAESNGLFLHSSGSWLAAANESVYTFQDLKLPKTEAFVKVCIAQWHLQSNPRKAKVLAEEALQFCQSCQSRQEAPALTVLVQAHLGIKDASKAFQSQEIEKAVHLAREGHKRFKSAGNQFGKASSLNALVLAYQAQENVEEALKAAEEAAEIYRTLGDKGGETSMLQMVAQLHLKRNQPEKAFQIAQEVKSLDISLQETAIAMETVYEAFLQQENFAQAFQTAIDLQLLCEDKGDKKREAIARLMIANVHYSQKNYSDTVLVAREAQALLHDLGAWTDEASALRVVAEGYMAKFEFEKALKAAERASRLLQGKTKGKDEAQALHLIAQVRLQILCQDKMRSQRGSSAFATALSEAAKAADGAASFAHKSNEPILEGQALLTAGQIQLVGLQCDEAFRTADDALAIFTEEGDLRNQANVFCLQADIHLTNGNTNKALVLVNKALATYQDARDARGEWIALGILERIIGPPELEYPQWTPDQMSQWQQWQQQQQPQQPQQRPQQASTMPQSLQQVAKPRRERRDLGERLNVNSLSIDTVRQRVSEMVKMTADLDDDDLVALDIPLMQVGVTSRTAVSLRNALSEEVPGVSLPFTLIFDYPSVNAISEMILDNVGNLPG